MNLAKRIRAGITGFLRPSPGLTEYAATTVRAAETNQSYDRSTQYRAAELVAMFAGTVKVAASLNAMGIAANPIRVYRRGGSKPGKSLGFSQRRVDRRRAKQIRHSAGSLARKSMDLDDDLTEIDDPLHPVVNWIKNPNALMDEGQAMELTAGALGLTGDAIWKVARGVDGVPVERWILPTQQVHIVPDRQTVIRGYIYGRGTENEQEFPASEVVHLKFPNFRGDPYHGLGDLAACVAEAKLGFQFVALAQAMIDNGGRPGKMIKGQFTPEQRKQLEVQLLTKTGGPQNAGRHVVMSVPDGAEIVDWSPNEQEMAFLNSSERVDRVVAACFGIPEDILKQKTGGLSGNSRTVYEWQEIGLQPRGRRIENGINRYIPALFGDPDIFVAFDPWVDEDEGLKNPVTITAYTAGILTKNEARARLGEDATDDPSGDEFAAPVAPAGGADGNQTGNAAPAQGAGGKGASAGKSDRGQDDLHSVARGVTADRQRADCGCGKSGTQSAHSHARAAGEGSGGTAVIKASTTGSDCVAVTTARLMRDYDTDEERARAAAERLCREGGGEGRGEGGGNVGAVGVPAGGHSMKPDPGACKSQRALIMETAEWKCCHSISAKDDRLRSTITATERQLEASLRSYFDHITPQVIGSVTDKGTAVQLSGNETFADHFNQLTEEALGSIYRSGLAEGVHDIAGQTDTAKLNEALTKGATGYLREYQGKLIRSVSDTIDGQIRNALADGMEQGESIPAMQQRVADVMGNVSKYGAERIARTESARAALSAREKAWSESGVVKGKRWLLSADPCPYCEAMAKDYNEADIGAPFLPLGSVLEGTDGSMMKIDYAAIDTPPLHPQCRCSLSAVFDTGDGE